MKIRLLITVIATMTCFNAEAQLADPATLFNIPPYLLSTDKTSRVENLTSVFQLDPVLPAGHAKYWDDFIGKTKAGQYKEASALINETFYSTLDSIPKRNYFFTRIGVNYLAGNYQQVIKDMDGIDISIIKADYTLKQLATLYRIIGDSYLEIGRYSKAVDSYFTLFSELPPGKDFSGAMFNTAIALFQLKDYERTIKYIDLALVFDYTDKKSAYLLRGISNLVTQPGKYEDANTDFQKILSENPADKNIGYYIALCQFFQGEFTACRNYSTELLKSGQDNIYRLRYLIAESYFADSREDCAVEELKNLSHENPRDLQSRIALAKILQRKDQLQSALAITDDCFKIDSLNAEVLFLKGNLLTSLPEKGSACEYLLRAHDLRSKDALTLLNAYCPDIPQARLHLSQYKGLDEAVEYGTLIDVESFLIRGVHPDNIGNSYSSYSLLGRAITLRKEQIALLLLQYGADPDKEYLYNPPLHLALVNGQKEVVKKLIEKGADPNIQGFNGNTALHYTCLLKDQLEILQLLIDYGADVHVKNNRGFTPLKYANISRQKEYSDLIKSLNTEK